MSASTLSIIRANKSFRGFVRMFTNRSGEGYTDVARRGNGAAARLGSDACRFYRSKFDKSAIRTMKESAVFDKPYIKATAWIASEALPETYVDELKNFSRRDFPTFKTRMAALEW
jgi:hypothetical protein